MNRQRLTGVKTTPAPRRPRSRSVLATVIATGLVLTGCGWMGATEDAADTLREHFDEHYSEHLDELEVNSDIGAFGLGGGTVAATAWFASDTPDDVLEAALADLEAFDSDHIAFLPAGVAANGIGICPADPQIEAKRAVRTGLADQGAELSGVWACPMRSSTTSQPYEGSWDELVADTALLDAYGLLAELELTATITGPTTTAEGPWAEVPVAETDAALELLHETLIVSSMELGPAAATIAVQPTADVSTEQAAVDAIAGDGISITIQNGTGTGGRTIGSDAGAMFDAIRATEGVYQVSDTPNGVSIRVADIEAAAAALQAGAEHEIYVESSIEVRFSLGEDIDAFARYIKTAGSDESDVSVLAALVEVEEITTVRWVQGAAGGIPGTSFTVATPDYTWVAQVKAALPEGTAVSVRGLHPTIEIDFPALPSLTEDDVTDRSGMFERSELVEAWNGATP